MTRAQYNDYLYLKSSIRKYKPSRYAEFYINTEYSAEYKQKATDLLTAIGFYPCRIGYPFWDRAREEGRKIIFIYYGSDEEWQYATFQEEREAFCREINEDR